MIGKLLIDRAILKQALESFETDWDGCVNTRMGEAISALRAALNVSQINQDDIYAEASTPVAWLATYVDKEGNISYYTTTVKELAVENDVNSSPQPLYLLSSQGCSIYANTTGSNRNGKCKPETMY